MDRPSRGGVPHMTTPDISSDHHVACIPPVHAPTMTDRNRNRLAGPAPTTEKVPAWVVTSLAHRGRARSLWSSTFARMADAERLRREWESFSEEWIARSESKTDAAREGLLDDWMLKVLGDVTDLDVIDLGCGEGRFCRMLAANGARTLGVDLQSAFIDYAKSKASSTEKYRIGDIQRLSGVPDVLFDLAVSYISLVDVADQQAAVREALRVLVPGGRFVVCNLSPMATAWVSEGPWHRDNDGTKLHFVLDDYATEGARRLVFPSGQELTNFHRMMSTTINDFLDAGFSLAGLYEPLPTPAQLARFPENEDLFRVPIFTIYDLVKSEG